MDILRDLEVDAEQRWMADVLVELCAIRKLLEKLVGKEECLLIEDWETTSNPNVIKREILSNNEVAK